MAAGKLLATENFNFWNEGVAEVNIKINNTKTEYLTFWFDGVTYAPSFKDANTSTMMPFFWGV